MTTAVLDLPRAALDFPELAPNLPTLREPRRANLPVALLTHNPAGRLSILPRLASVAVQGGLPMPTMSKATVDGERIPILAGMETHISVRSLKALMDLGQIAGLMLVTASSRGRMLKDDETVNLADDLTLRVIRLNLAS